MKQSVSSSLLVLFLALGLVLLMGCMSSRPQNLGVKNGSLAVCPETPNCVCSQCPREDSEHFIAPISYAVPEQSLRELISESLEQMARTKVVTATDNYFHVESTTLLLRFVDDFELYIDSGQNLLHFRSASRIGRSDFGTNRKRVETFKQMLSAKLKNKTS